MHIGEIAILTSLIRLFESYGINPCEPAVHLSWDEAAEQTVLSFEGPPLQEREEARFDKLLKEMAVDEETMEIRGSDSELYLRIQEAIRRSPFSGRSL